MPWLTHDHAIRGIATSIARLSPRRHPALFPEVERVVGLVGPAGVGKTSIARSLASFLAAQGTSCTHVALDGLLYPRTTRQRLGVNGYQLQGWQQQSAEEILRALLCGGSSICIPEYQPDGTLGPGTQVSTASYILLDGNYSLLGPIGELVDTFIFFDADLETLKHLRYERDVISEGRFTPGEEQAVWDRELEALEHNILRKKESAQILVRLDKDRQYQVWVR